MYGTVISLKKVFTVVTSPRVPIRLVLKIFLHLRPGFFIEQNSSLIDFEMSVSFLWRAILSKKQLKALVSRPYPTIVSRIPSFARSSRDRDQDSVRICSLAVNMNNTDESFFFTVGVLKL